MAGNVRCWLFVAGLSILIPPRAIAQPSARHNQLDRQVRAAIAGFQGAVSLYAKNLDTGESYGVRENERVRTASTIKLAIWPPSSMPSHAGRPSGPMS